MMIARVVLPLLCLLPVTLGSEEAKVTPLFSKDLPDFPGKEGVTITVEYPPGSSDPIHRHNADALVYVLEGSIVMQLRGGNEVTLTPGQTFCEGPNDVQRRREERKPNQTRKIRGFPG
jgi:quercetin dioxygenase-like cupin family protein